MSDRLLVSTRKGLFALARTSSGWSVERHSFVAENITLALADPRTTTWYAALDLGHFGVKLKASNDRGATWEDRAVPEYPAGEEIITGDGKPPVPAKLKLIWALEAGPASQPGRLWAGTVPGGLFHSDDGGQSWHLCRGLWDLPERKHWFGGGVDTPGMHSVCIDPRDPNVVRVAVSTAGVWRTTDGGATWEVTANGMFAEYMPPDQRNNPIAQDVHRMVQCPGAPDVLWVQHHNGVFRSTDAGLNWTHVAAAAPSGFGFGVAVHPRDPNLAWFVPAKKDEHRLPVDGKFVVSRTRDGGASFEVLTNGLPTIPAYDLVFRHALDIDTTGNRLAVGSTTGGVWISENQGDLWSQVPVRFPQVYAVRFVD